MAAISLEMTPDELIAYLRHSAIPTLLVEGLTDLALLRSIEHELASQGVDILPVHGKERLSMVYGRRCEISDRAVVFLRDRDEFIVEDVPQDWSDYVLTQGYSIENDVLCPELIRKLSGVSWGGLNDLVEKVAIWFRLALQLYLDSGKRTVIARDVSFIISGGELTDQALQEVSGVVLKPPVSELAIASAWSWVRGKMLLRAIHFHFQSFAPSYSQAQLMDLCLKMGSKRSMKNLIVKIQDKFEERISPLGR